MNIQSVRQTKFSSLPIYALALILAWLLAQLVLQDTFLLAVPFVIGLAIFAVLQTLKDWRKGLLFFLGWMMFEDLARKFLGNNLAILYTKDVLAAICCVSFFAARKRERFLKVRPAFFFPFTLFLAWATLEVFNPNSPSIWYGILGLQLYFSYVPLFFLGYALLRKEADLQKLLLFNLGIAGAIAALGVAQAISGQNLLSPATLAPDIRELGSLMREAPITHEVFNRPASVFVSDGRYTQFLLLAWLMSFGTAAYFFMRDLPGKKWVVSITALLMAAIVLSGSRGILLYSWISSAVIAPIFMREMTWKDPRKRKIVMSVTSTLLLATSAVVFLYFEYPQALMARANFYQQTLLPSSATSELGWRAWGYPVQELSKAFASPNWILGYGTGTCSLGSQYLTRILGAPPIKENVESGYGNLLLEMGVPGLLLWLLWSCVMISSSWKIVKQLRGTPLFPIGLEIFWFSLILLFPFMIGGLTGYQNFVMNAYMWLLLGVLFSLPRLTIAPRKVGASSQKTVKSS